MLNHNKKMRVGSALSHLFVQFSGLSPTAPFAFKRNRLRLKILDRQVNKEAILISEIETDVQYTQRLNGMDWQVKDEFFPSAGGIVCAGHLDELSVRRIKDEDVHTGRHGVIDVDPIRGIVKKLEGTAMDGELGLASQHIVLGVIGDGLRFCHRRTIGVDVQDVLHHASFVRRLD